MADFKAALPKPGSWSVGESQFDEGGKFLKLSIPLESVHELCGHLMAMADDVSKQKTIKVWNYDTNQLKKSQESSLLQKARTVNMALLAKSILKRLKSQRSLSDVKRPYRKLP